VAMAPVPAPQDVTRVTLSILTIVGLLAATLLIVMPFVPALVWGTTIVISTWPVMQRLQSWLGGRRGAAVAVMTILLLVIIVIPLYAAIDAVVERTEKLPDFLRSLGENGLPPPPDWLGAIPLVGPRLTAAWQQLATGGLAGRGADLGPWVARAVRFVAAQARGLGTTILQFLVTVVVAAVLYATGERAGLAVRRFFRRLAGQRGDGAVVLAGKAIRAVALGVMVTALTQTVLSGIGLLIAGVPHAGVLTAVVLLLCVAQVGPALVLIPAIIWLYASGHPGTGTFLLIWSVAPLTVDNFMRPLLIKRGADLPLWLIFIGVVGGLLAFGIIGLFIGPVFLAVTYTLVSDWVGDLGPEAQSAAPADGGRVTGLGGAP